MKSWKAIKLGGQEANRLESQEAITPGGQNAGKLESEEAGRFESF